VGFIDDCLDLPVMMARNGQAAARQSNAGFSLVKPAKKANKADRYTAFFA
jgi:hypothetical protein